MQNISTTASDPTAPEAIHLERRDGAAECGETGGPFGALAEADCGKCLAALAARREAEAREAAEAAEAARFRLAEVKRGEDGIVRLVTVNGRTMAGTLWPDPEDGDTTVFMLAAAGDYVARLNIPLNRPPPRRWGMEIRVRDFCGAPGEQRGKVLFRAAGLRYRRGGPECRGREDR